MFPRQSKRRVSPHHPHGTSNSSTNRFCDGPQSCHDLKTADRRNTLTFLKRLEPLLTSSMERSSSVAELSETYRTFAMLKRNFLYSRITSASALHPEMHGQYPALVWNTTPGVKTEKIASVMQRLIANGC